MSTVPLSPFAKHVQRWTGCTKCPLCTGRRNMVFARGQLPASVLFCGEAPGASEDVLGSPFVGPAGHLLDDIIKQALYDLPPQRIAFTNLVACYPKEEKAAGVNEPPTEAIKACAPRLKEFVRIAQPRLIVLVGTLAKKWIAGQAQFSIRKDNSLEWIPPSRLLQFVEIVHPAFILRSNIANRGLLVQQCMVRLRAAVEEL